MMRSLTSCEEQLIVPQVADFSPAELAALPEPARGHLAAVIAPGTPLARSARLTMRGRIKIGRWLPFRAREVLSPHRGFVWAARAGGIIVGSDRFVDGAGAMDWKLAGLVPVMRGDGPDISRVPQGAPPAKRRGFRPHSCRASA